MTLWEMIKAFVRWWLVVLIGCGLTGAVGLFAIRDRGVYFARSEVIFLVPATWSTNVLETTPESMVIVAGAVAKRAAGPQDAPRYGSLAATIVGTTTQQEATWIRIEDQGGQWAPDIRSPIILVDVVAPSLERARELHREAIERIRSALAGLQDEFRFAREDSITMEVAPKSAMFYRVQGNRVRALGMTGILGMSLTVTAVLLLERRRIRRGQLSNTTAKAPQTGERFSVGV